ncbi:AraC family transcriptional regulator [Pseudoalteromonas sp. MMG022]|uniref:helix-turn-helix domain-containing protein n=1 Tax=Pseudoalteromonas sp. MMG022 TaxID=2909978 RepID=UPI001F396F72|nr:AraC family transcriptional regulator [Pseudoalteromonas sp. MMG022]MCF6436852.1 AraC family transcriptional regulator [Pseudoalteromonas sp. MMG022]
MDQPFEMLLSGVTLGVGGFSCYLIAYRMRQQPFYIPLFILLLALTFLSAGGVVFAGFEQHIFSYIAILAPSFLLLAPSLWLYARALTASTPWCFQLSHCKHFIPAFMSLSLSFATLLAPNSLLQEMFFSDQDVTPDFFSVFISVATMLTIAIWFLQTVGYLLNLAKLTHSYHMQLRNVFCDLTNKKLKWLRLIVVAMLLSATWASLAIMDVNLAIFDAIWGQLLCLLTIWWLGYFGLTQQPGFAVVYKENQQQAQQDNIQLPRYQRSALSSQQSQSIAQKVQQAIESDKLYLDSQLTLYKLAKHINEPSQYVSQTLSQVMQTSFFECINNARVEAAKDMLRSDQHNVLDVAMSVGFNARSSFYKAFKSRTNMTPSQFKKSTKQ